ncbi:MAG TPA: acyl carrier protein [Steroidobacteraceae bacterium]|nr:acyl carrier protein [Steroidobacteraceae bacterium]
MGTLETLQGILAEELKLDPGRLTSEARLEDLGVDSLGLLELMFKIEDRFNLKIKDDIPRTLVTIHDVVLYIDDLLKKVPASEPTPSSADGAS